MPECSELLSRWAAMADRIDDEIVDLLWQRQQIRMIAEMIGDNRRLRNPRFTFLWEARRWYLVFASMAVRRQCDRGRQLVSLAQLLSEVKDNPGCFNRELFVKHVRTVYKENADPDSEYEVVNLTWEKWRNPMTGSFSIERVESDLEELRAACSKLVAFAGSTIAHTSKKAIERKFNLTFDDLDRAIDMLETLALAYRGLVTGIGGYSLVPTPQHNWFEQFSFPWRPPTSEGK